MHHTKSHYTILAADTEKAATEKVDAERDKKTERSKMSANSSTHTSSTSSDTSCAGGQVAPQKGGKKGKRPKYKVLDLSENIDSFGNNKVSEDTTGLDHQNHDEKQGDLKEEEDGMDESWYDDHDVEEDVDERQRGDKGQEYHLFVKSNRKRGHCTTKKSKRPRSSSR